ncbi:MAG: SRPBCC family protein [Dongiaceae bacterium]
MTERAATHATFVIERSYDASPARVFKAWADPAAKARWFAGPSDWKLVDRAIDFRVGGREHLRGAWPSGTISAFDAQYHDIVPDQRIIYAYDMRLDERHISVSLATVELKPAGKSTRLIFTEQAAFLDGYDDAGGRERGTGALLDKLGAELRLHLQNAAPGRLSSQFILK